MCWIWKDVFHDDNVDNDDIEDGGGDDNEDDLSSYNATMAMVIMMFMRMTAIICPVTTRVLATKVVQVEGIGQRGRSRFVMMPKILMMMVGMVMMLKGDGWWYLDRRGGPGINYKDSGDDEDNDMTSVKW